MNLTRTVVGALAVLVLSIILSPQIVEADCGNICGAPNVFLNTSPAAPPVAKSDNPDTEFSNRVDSAVAFGSSCILPLCEKCGRPDYGQDYQRIIFALLEAGSKGDQPKLTQAITSLRGIKKSDLAPIGTDSPLSGVCKVPEVGGILADLVGVFTNAAREGDGDTAMIGFINIL